MKRTLTRLAMQASVILIFVIFAPLVFLESIVRGALAGARLGYHVGGITRQGRPLVRAKLMARWGLEDARSGARRGLALVGDMYADAVFTYYVVKFSRA